MRNFTQRRSSRALTLSLCAPRSGARFLESVGWRGVKGHGDDDVEAKEHSSFEIVGFAVLDSVRDNEN